MPAAFIRKEQDERMSPAVREGDQLNIGFIGAGKVGCSLGKYFADGGLQVKGYYSRTSEKTQEAARFTDSEVFADEKSLTDACDVIFLTVPDGRITSVWNDLKRFELNGKLICHCSGAMSSRDAFPGIEKTGAFGYSIHPLFAVSDRFNAYRELTDVFFTLEGGERGTGGKPCAGAATGGGQDTAEALRSMDGSRIGADQNAAEQEAADRKVEALMKTLGNPYQWIDASHKTTYHCAAAMASNLVCGLIDQSIELMQRCGFAEEAAVKALAPILMGNMAHIAADGPTASLTGPIERNDVQTVVKHLNCLENEAEQELYTVLSQRLVQMAQRRHTDRDYAGMSQLLRKEKEK